MISDNEYLRVARITGSHALNGRLKIYVVSDILGRFKKGGEVFLKLKEDYKTFIIEDFGSLKGKVALLKLKGVDDRNSADLLRGVDVFIGRSKGEEARDGFDEDTFFYHDLVGCRVYLDGEEFGNVVDIMEAGAGEILMIKDKKDHEVLVPFVGSMVNTERVSEGIIEITPVEGLLDF